MGMVVDPYRFAAAGAFDPTDISGLHVWFDANAITGKADGDTLTTWLDESGNGRDATAPTGEEPTYETGVLNGLPVVQFSASVTKRMATASWTAISQPYTVFVVGRSRAVVFSQLVDGLGASNRLALYRDALDTTLVLFAGADSRQLLAPAVSTAHRIYTLEINGASSVVSVDGAVQASMTNPGTNTMIGLTIGNRYASAFESASQIAEVLVYDSALSSVNVGAVETYLSDKWGVTL